MNSTQPVSSAKNLSRFRSSTASWRLAEKSSISDRLSILRADPRREWLQAIATTCKDEPLEDQIRVPLEAGGGGLAQAYLTSESHRLGRRGRGT